MNDSIARVCASDGTWVSQSCTSDEMCMDGACVAKADVACQPTDSVCMDSTHAVDCNANGVGFTSVTCPTGTTCIGTGICMGTCAVGSSRCNGTGIVQTCMDGFTYKDSDCTPGMTSCVTTSLSNAPVQTAACMPMACTPVGTVCGDKASDPTSTDPSYASTCVSSPSGYHWQSEQCAIASSCQPGSGCVQQCIPGSQRCNGLGIQTCGTNAQWGAITACQPTATGAEQVCQVAPYSSTPICGDPVCAVYSGACESDGYHPCVNGKVAATAQPCTTGVCVGGNTYGGFTGGSCQAQCNPGDTECDGDEAYVTCGSDGRWSSTVTQCPVNGTDRCVQYTDPASGGSRTICGQCAPGTHRCTDGSGNPLGSPQTDIETCDSTGHYGAYQACTVGTCQSAGGDAACAAQCVPGSTVCMGTVPASPPNPEHPGTTSWGTCNSDGTLPATPTACATGTSCRKGPNGQPVGTGQNACVVCVGPGISGGNEIGLVDSYCTATASPGSLETCNASNQWSAATTCSTTAPYSGVCKQEGNQVCNGSYCTNSFLTSIGYGGCAGYWGTGYQSWGSTPDCCSVSYYCLLNSGLAGPAACE